MDLRDKVGLELMLEGHSRAPAASRVRNRCFRGRVCCTCPNLSRLPSPAQHFSRPPHHFWVQGGLIRSVGKIVVTSSVGASSQPVLSKQAKTERRAFLGGQGCHHSNQKILGMLHDLLRSCGPRIDLERIEVLVQHRCTPNFQ